MSGGISYRRAALSDLRAIATMERRFFGRHAFGLGMLFYLLLHAGEGFLVAESGGGVIGYLVARRESVRRARAELPTFAVHEDMRGRGVGTALLTEALTQLERVGVSQVDLQVAVENHGALRLYERFGFSIVRTLPGYYGPGEDAFLMRRSAGIGSDAASGEHGL